MLFEGIETPTAMSCIKLGGGRIDVRTIEGGLANWGHSVYRGGRGSQNAKKVRT